VIGIYRVLQSAECSVSRILLPLLRLPTTANGRPYLKPSVAMHFHHSLLTLVLQGLLMPDDLEQEGRLEAFLSENHSFDSQDGKYLLIIVIRFPMTFLRCYILTK
jgi:hypothetical protein